MAALEEAEQHAGRAVGRRVVEREPHRAAIARGLPGQPLGAPERLVVDRHALDDRAQRHPLGELVAVAGQRRVVRDPARERGRHRHDRAPAARGRAVGVHRHAVAGRARCAAPARRARPLLAELLGHPERDPLRAAHEAVLLGAALRVEQQLERARRVDVEEHVQERHVLGLRRPHGLHTQLEQHAARLRRHVAAHPGRHRLAVELRRARGLPGRVERNLPGQAVEAGLRLLDVQRAPPG